MSAYHVSLSSPPTHTFKPTIDDSVAMTPFYLLLGKHRKQQQEESDIQSGVRTLLPQGSVAIKEVGNHGY